MTSLQFQILPIALLLLHSCLASALLTSSDINPPYPKAILDLKEAIVRGLGLPAEEFKITGFDPRDAQVGHSVEYEFGVEIDHKVIPFRFIEDVNRWEHQDLSIFRVNEPGQPGDQTALVENRNSANGSPSLAPFQLAGPMELWIQDAKDMRLSLPHDVDAGVLKKVVLADGAVVTVKGAKSVSLRHPLDLPLPLNRTQNGFAAGLLTLAEQLRQASRSPGAHLLSLRIVGPTSLASPTSSSSTSFSNNRLKLKRLAPGLVELSSPSNAKAIEPYSAVDLQDEAPTLLASTQFTRMWPIPSLNGSNANLLGFEALLSSVLGPNADKEGSFRLLKADVSAQTFVKMRFEAVKKLKEGEINLEGFPEWRTKPEMVRLHFEVLAKVDGDKVIPETILQVDPIIVEDTVAPNVLTGNLTMSRMPIIYPPPNFFSL